MKKLKDYIIEQVGNKKLSPTEAADFLDEIDNVSGSADECVIVGMSCRLPRANTLAAMWKIFTDKIDCVDNFPRKRADDAVYVSEDTYDKYYGYSCRVGTYLDEIDKFDNGFFGLTPAESRLMDPAQRIFLQVAVEAMENAGISKKELNGSRTGVYVGYSVGDDNYIDLLSKEDPNVSIGNQPSMLAYRLSFLFNLTGPTMIIDTACSASLVAVYEAMQAIKRGECDQAIVAGINLRIFPAIKEIGNLGIEAYDGRCKTFDERANGTNIGEGIAVLVLKPKKLALQDRNPIHAILRGGAINSDGASNGITAPNPVAQTKLLEEAWKNSGIDPINLAFIETHGTGTKLGDPIEILGLTEAFKKFTDKKAICPLGAAKSNIGHLEAASGIAGLMKAVLSLQAEILPPNIHYNNPNPFIDFENSAVFPNAEFTKLSNKGQSLIAGVSSFGISGTNCHVVLEIAPEISFDRGDNQEQYLLCISGKTPASLRNTAKKHADFLLSTDELELRDVALTLARGRDHYDYRTVIRATSLDEAQKAFLALSQSEDLFIQDEIGLYCSSSITSSDLGASTSKYLNDQEKTFIESYINLKSIAWDEVFPLTMGKKVHLPTYAFEETRYWPKLSVKKAESLEEQVESVFFDLEWNERSLNEKGLMSVLPDEKTIVFANECQEHKAFIDYCRGQGLDLIVVHVGKQLVETGPDSWTMDPLDHGHYDILFNTLKAQNTKPIRGLLHMWSAKPEQTEEEYQNDVLISQDLGAFSLFHTINGIARAWGNQNFRLACICSHAYQILEGEWVDPRRTPSMGVCMVASQEYPLIKSISIDVEFAGLTAHAKGELFKEIFLSSDYENGFVGYRENSRFAHTLVQKNLTEYQKQSDSIVEGGVYLIAGGAGYLGIQSAFVMAQKKKVKVILVGRKETPVYTAQQQQALDEISLLGTQVEYRSSDVTDKSECQRLVKYIEEKYGRIDGIYLAIKNISHQRMEEVKFDDFRRNILSKIMATTYLDQMTRHLKPDFMANFSSISSLTGGPTGADCCASNLFLDTFGDWRDPQGFSTITMNYTLIEADDGSLLSDRMSMIPPLSKEEFQQCLSRCIFGKIPFSFIAQFSAHVMPLVLPFIKIRFAQELVTQFQKGSKQKRLRDTTTDLSDDILDSELDYGQVLSSMHGIWQEVLGYDTIEPNSNFFDIGGDSISAVKLMHLVKTRLQVELDISQLYSYPVLEDLCRMIAGVPEEKQRSLDDIINDLDSGKLDISAAVEEIETV